MTSIKNTPIQDICNNLNKILGAKSFYMESFEMDNDTIISYDKEEGSDISIIEMQDGKYKFCCTGHVQILPKDEIVQFVIEWLNY
jgi:hypothetical protein